MLTEFMTVTGWTFWVALFLLASFEMFLLSIDDSETHGFATAIAVAGVAAIILFTDAFNGVRIMWLLITGAGYLALGIIWSIKKWYDFVVEIRDKWRAIFDKNVKDKTTTKTWEEYSKEHRPSAAENKQRIVSWMVLWPFSVTWWALTWPRRAFAWLYERISTLFDRITDRIFA